MADQRQTTSAANGTLWGEQAQDWAELQEGQCRGVYETVLQKADVRPGMRYLDAGCGAGMAVMLAAAMGASVSGLDASEELLAIAKGRVPTADLRCGELEQLPFADGSFNLVTGFNSFQYAANPVAALREAGRVTRPGGTVVIMTWGEPAGMPAARLVAALKPLLPPPPPDAPGPFALSDREALMSFATQAALRPVQIVDVDCPWDYAHLEQALRGLGSSGVAARARRQSGAAAVDDAHSAALQAFLQADGSYRIGASFRCLFATTA